MTFDKTIVDLGTGDGRFVYKEALKNPNNLYIGIDPSEKQLAIYTREINKKRLKNAKFIVGSADNLPKYLIGTVDEVNINFPWGRLLEVVVKADTGFSNIVSLLKVSGLLKIIFGYHTDLEPSESSRLELSDISFDYVKNSLSEKYKTFGLYPRSITLLSKSDLKALESSWGKRLAFGRDREIYQLIFERV